MRALVLLSLLVSGPALAQSGRGGIEGTVVPMSAVGGGYLEAWPDDGAPDAHRPTIRLEPVRVLDADRSTAVEVTGEGIYGRYRASRLSMGLWRITVSAPGCAAWTAEIYVGSDHMTSLNVPLACGTTALPATD